MEHIDSSKQLKNINLELWPANLLIAILIFAVTLLIAASTIPKYGITWDEPLSFFAGVKQIDNWIKAVKKEWAQSGIVSAFSRELTVQYWEPPTKDTQRYDFYNNHPPFTRLAGYLSWGLLHGISSDLFSMRFAAALAYALMVALIFLFGCVISRRVGFFAVLFVLTIPRLFGFSHFLTTEVFLTAFWILSAFCFWHAMHSRWPFWYISFWIIFGISVNVKFTALFIPFPMILFALLYHRNQILSLMKWFPLSLIPAYFLNPTWWHDPISIFFKNHMLLSIRRTSYFNPSAFYFGKVYGHTPWHYPIIQTMLTLPVIILFLFLSFFYLFYKRKKDRQILKFILINLFAIFVMACLPNTPRYDGVRLFLPVFPFIGFLAAYSAATIYEYYRNRIKQLKYKLVGSVIGFGIILIIIGHQTLQTAMYVPYELSYYNEIAGGLSGAFKLGMEATYWLEAITPEFVSEINGILPFNTSLGNYPEDGAILKWYQKNGFLRDDIRVVRMKNAEYIVVVNRRASLRREALELIDNNHQALIKTELDGVPLVILFGPF